MVEIYLCDNNNFTGKSNKEPYVVWLVVVILAALHTMYMLCCFLQIRWLKYLLNAYKLTTSKIIYPKKDNNQEEKQRKNVSRMFFFLWYLNEHFTTKWSYHKNAYLYICFLFVIWIQCNQNYSQVHICDSWKQES